MQLQRNERKGNPLKKEASKPMLKLLKLKIF